MEHLNDRILDLSRRQRKRFDKRYNECFNNREFYEAHEIDYENRSACTPFLVKKALFYQMFGNGEEKSKKNKLLKTLLKLLFQQNAVY